MIKLVHKTSLALSCSSLVILFFSCAHTNLGYYPTLGIVYKTFANNNDSLSHIAIIDPKINKLILYQAKNPLLKTVSELAQEHNALVAINAGFFTAEGYPVGMLKIDGKIISKPTKIRGVFGWGKNNTFFFDRLGPGKNGEQLVSLLHKKPWWDQADNIIGGAPLLIFKGEIMPPDPEGALESFIKNSYARTAVCVDIEKHINFFVINGGDSKTVGLGGGMSILELAEFLLKQGCIDALNLDGGYSSSFVLAGKKRNQFNLNLLPERPISTMLMVVQ